MRSDSTEARSGSIEARSGPTESCRRAEAAVALAAVDPAEARRVAGELLAAPRSPETRVVALRALALADKELGRLDEGIGHLREAVEAAERAGLDYRAAQARMSLVGLLAAKGESAAALAAADAAAPVLCGVDAARLLTNRAYALSRAGHMEDALAACQAALPRLRAARDEVFLAGTLVNTALIHLYRGDARPATAHLSEALSVARARGLRHLALMARDGLAFAALRSGDLPRALAEYDALETAIGEVGERAGQVRLGRAQALLAARLPDEARTVLIGALPMLADSGYAADHAEARLLLSHAELACAHQRRGEFTTAARIAESAGGDFLRQGRPGWALLAEHFAVRARWGAGDRSPELLERARGLATRLTDTGWMVAALDSTVVAGRLALALGRHGLARALLRAAPIPPARSPLVVQVASWHVRALERLSGGDRRGAAAAVRAGLAAIERHALVLGAAELRAHATGWGTELAALGLRLALTAGRPRAVLAWAERCRSVAHRPDPVRPPADPQLAAELSRLRQVCDRLAAAVGTGEDPTPWQAARLRLEASIQERTRRAAARRGTGAATGGAATVPPPGRLPEALVEALGDRALVAFVHSDGALLAVSMVAGRCRLWPLGPYERAVHGTRVLRFEAHRLVRDAAHPASRRPRSRPDEAAQGGTGAGAHGASPTTGLDAAAGAMDALLFGPLHRSIGDRDLVVVPTGHLHGLPWPALPSLSGRPVSVAPSAAAWLRAVRPSADRPAGRPGHAVLIAGPGLRHAQPEIAALRGLYPGATVLTGEAAHADAVRAALDGADLAHVSAHGYFRTGNALFSGLRLSDGPLLAYDLEALRRPPRRVVLAACDAGRGAVHGTDAIVGMAGVLLGYGTRTVIASVTPVADGPTADLMRGFHKRLADGAAPARALADAPQGPETVGFVCFGEG